MNTENPVYIEVVADRSGSMASIVQDAIGGYNTWLAAQQAVPGAALLTLSLFDHEHLTQPTVSLFDAKPLDGTTYVPRGSTALNDAIGRALGRLSAINPAKAILVILTDGQENASTEFTTAQIKEKITQAEARGWQVVYLSADANAFADGAKLGISTRNTMQFSHDSAGVARAYTATATLNAEYRSGNLGTTLADVDPQNNK